MADIHAPTRLFQICANCCMDTTDTKIVFDERGWCDYCVNYYEHILPNWHTDARGEAEIWRQIDEIKAYGKGRDHDCLIGLSGGVDSSYLVYLAKEKFGLRPLLYHVDAGWNSQQAVNNIEKLVDGLGLDLFTEVVNWPEMRDLQLSFFKSGVSHLDAPQDMAFFAGLYNFAAKNKVRYILTGANYSTECVREPLDWDYHKSDLRQLKDIHAKHGSMPLKTYPLCGIFKFKLYYRYVKGVRVVKPLNYVPYIKDAAMDELVEKFGWQKYAHKHYESRFTRFYEGYWLPTTFGYDKRKPHYASVILTGQMTREDALDKLSRPAYDPATIDDDFEYIATKLGISVDELRSYHAMRKRTYKEYKNYMPLIQIGTVAQQMLGMEHRVLR